MCNLLLASDCVSVSEICLNGATFTIPIPSKFVGIIFWCVSKLGNKMQHHISDIAHTHTHIHIRNTQYATRKTITNRHQKSLNIIVMSHFLIGLKTSISIEFKWWFVCGFFPNHRIISPQNVPFDMSLPFLMVNHILMGKISVQVNEQHW